MKRLVSYIDNLGRHMGLHLLALILLGTGCSHSVFNGMKNYINPPATAPVSWFVSDTGHYLFNTKIHLMKNHFSGLMVVKPLEEDHYRVIFITETGLKIFDMEFFPDREMMVHYVMDALDRKALINTLSNDVGLVLMNNLRLKQPDILIHKGSGDIVFRYDSGNRKSFYFLNETGSKPYLVRQTGCLTNKVRANLYGNPGRGIDSVNIKHNHLRLTIHLYRIHENGLAAE